MQKRRLIPVVLAFSCALLPGAPAAASEVVKLARLVITGKRLSAERLEPVALQKALPAAPQTRAPQPAVASATPAPLAAGQDVASRSSTAPSRGVVSFF